MHDRRRHPHVALLARLVIAPLLGALLVLAALLAAPGEAAAQCTVCESCTGDAECGPGGVCVSFGDGTSVCSQDCSASVCPGDSRCFQVPAGTETYLLCFNPGAGDSSIGVCPASYACSEVRTCPSAGTSCANGGAACGSDTEVCPSDSTGFQFCSCFCESSLDCGPNGTCTGLQGDPRGVCVAGANTGLCADVMCPAGQTCDPGTGNCISDPNDLCADVMCPAGAICSPATGTCIGGSTDTSPTEDTAPADTSTTDTDTSPPADTSTTTDTATTSSDTSADVANNDTGGSQLDPLEEDCSCRALRRETAPGSRRVPLGLASGALLFGLLALRRRRR